MRLVCRMNRQALSRLTMACAKNLNTATFTMRNRIGSIYWLGSFSF